MMTRSQVRKHQQKHFKELISKKTPYTKEFENITLTFNKNVFLPCADTRLLARNFTPTPGSSVLELTTGSGAISALAGTKGCFGIAVDINPFAVKNANLNFRNLNINFKAIKSNGFSNVPKRKFDFILANPPYLDGKIDHVLKHSFFGISDLIKNIFQNATKFLNPGGKMLITFASWGLIKKFENEAQKNGFKWTIVDSIWSDDKKGQYFLYSFTLD